MKPTKSVPQGRGRIGRVAALALAAALTFILSISPAAFASGVQLNASLQPSRISLDGAAQLDVTLQDVQAGTPSLPQVKGLTFTPMGQSSASESVNGVTTASVSLTYRVTATTPGRYTIPGIRFQGSSTAPLTLEVSAAGTPADSGAANQVPSGTAFVRLIAPKRKLYVGELLPVQIKAYFRSDLGVNVDGQPALQSDAFTLSNLSNTPQQSQEQIRGVAYTTLTWFTALVPIKNGEYPLTLELPVTLQGQAAPTSLQMPDLASLFGKGGIDALFDDSALQSLMGQGQARTQSVTLKSPATTLAVMPLPTLGQPADFSGAVGSFQLERQAAASPVAEGDPLSLTYTVNGTGNFDRVNSPGLRSDGTWKAYRPQVTFTPQDSVGGEGVKTFTQTLVPIRAGHLRLPPVEFSYFDPKSAQYVVRHTQPLEVTVTPGAAPAGAPSPVLQAAANTPPAGGNQPASNGPQLSPLKRTAGSPHASLIPIAQRGWFPALPAVPFAVLAGGLLLIRRREQQIEDPAAIEAAREAEVQALLTRMEDAVKRKDGPAFISAARRALQMRLGHAWSMPPTHVSLAELDARLDTSWDSLRQLFILADQSAYGGWRPPGATLAQWHAIVHEQLQRAKHL